MEQSSNTYNQQYNGTYTPQQIQYIQMCYQQNQEGYYNYYQYPQMSLEQYEKSIQLQIYGKFQNKDLEIPNSQQQIQCYGKGRNTSKKPKNNKISIHPVQTNNTKFKYRKGVKYQPKGKITELEKEQQKLEQQQSCQQEKLELENQIKNDQNQSGQSESEQEEQQYSQSIPQQVDQQGLQILKSRGFYDQSTNMTLMLYFKNNVGEVQKCLKWCNSQQAYKQALGSYQKNFMISKYLGFVGQELFHWQVLSVIEKNNNNLSQSIQKLNKRIKSKQRQKQVDRQSQNFTFNTVSQIPKDSIFMIDGSNAIRSNKHLKKLMKEPDHKSKLESILRLKNLVQTLASGYLVLDKKFQTQQVQNQIMKNLITVTGQKKIKLLYADEGYKADDKIVQILNQMPIEKRNHALVVTSDALLRKQCQDVCGSNLAFMGGKVFIKECKKMIPKGVLKNKILSGYRNNPLIES